MSVYPSMCMYDIQSSNLAKTIMENGKINERGHAQRNKIRIRSFSEAKEIWALCPLLITHTASKTIKNCKYILWVKLQYLDRNGKNRPDQLDIEQKRNFICLDIKKKTFFFFRVRWWAYLKDLVTAELGFFLINRDYEFLYPLWKKRLYLYYRSACTTKKHPARNRDFV